MNLKAPRFAYFGLVSFILISSLTSCRSSSTTESTPIGSSPSASPAAEDKNPATITEIQKQPVSVRPLNAAKEIPAKTGMGLQYGETIRTQKTAMAEIGLENGLAFRIGGNAVLTLQPDNRLNLSEGNMITWVQPGQKVPTEIVTPTAVAGIRGTTVYVEIPKDPKQETVFFTWEGTVAVSLPGRPDTLELKTGEEVKIRPGEKDMRQIRRRVRRLSRAEWRAKLRDDRLLRGFNRQMPTLPIIEKLSPGQRVPVAPSDQK